MILKSVFLGKSIRPNTASESLDITDLIPEIEEFTQFRKDAAEGNNRAVQAFLDKYSGEWADISPRRGWSALELAHIRRHPDTVALLRKAQTSLHPSPQQLRLVSAGTHPIS